MDYKKASAYWIEKDKKKARMDRDELLAFKKIPAENLKKLPVTMNLIKITPAHIDFLCSELKSLGFDPRQSLDLSGSDTE